MSEVPQEECSIFAVCLPDDSQLVASPAKTQGRVVGDN